MAFLNRYSLLLAISMVLISAVRIVSTHEALSITADEPTHIACGIEYLARHTYTREPQHPPLSRAAAALLPYCDGAHPMGFPFHGDEGVALLDASNDAVGMLARARLGELPFFLLACAVVYLGARWILGNAGAAVATALFTLLPNVLADAGLATTDIALAACAGAAFFSMTWWASRPTWPRGILMGVAWGLAAVSKFTALGFLPAAVAFALTGYIVVRRPGFAKLAALARERVATGAAAALLAALVIWVTYFFSFGPAPGWHLSLPAPEFFQGILDAARHNEKGHLAYLMGHTSQTGWWYYFPIAILVKTPIAFLMLLSAGGAIAWRDRAKGAYLPLAFSLGILIVAITGHVNIGIRHILPAYLGFAMTAAAGAVELIRRPRWGTLACGILASWMAISGAVAHPDYLAYFNEVASRHPENVLVDSNLDWGQDLKLLSSRLDAWNIRELGAYGLDLANLHGTIQKWYGLPPTREATSSTLPPGWYAVGQTVEKLNPSPAGFERFTPVARIGGVLIYHAH